ncbi:MAG: hypothetical protein C4291_09590 [Candidatus Dadabacteria bacterium]
MISRIVFLTALFILFSGSAHAGWIIDQAIHSASPQEPTNRRVSSTNYFSRNRFKAVQDGSILIINYNTDRIFVSDRYRKLYWSGTIDEYINGIRDYMAQAKRQMEESMKDMPSEQRRAIEEEMRESGGPIGSGHVRIEKTSDRQTIAGYRATKYIVYLGENSYQEIWISEDLDISKDMDMKKIEDFQNRINRTVGSVYSKGANVEESSEYQSLFEKGYPLKIVHVVGQNRGVIEVTDVKETGIPDREFEVPESYTRTTLQEIIRSREGR